MEIYTFIVFEHVLGLFDFLKFGCVFIVIIFKVEPRVNICWLVDRFLHVDDLIVGFQLIFSLESYIALALTIVVWAKEMRFLEVDL